MIQELDEEDQAALDILTSEEDVPTSGTDADLDAARFLFESRPLSITERLQEAGADVAAGFADTQASMLESGGIAAEALGVASAAKTMRQFATGIRKVVDEMAPPVQKEAAREGVQVMRGVGSGLGFMLGGQAVAAARLPAWAGVAFAGAAANAAPAYYETLYATGDQTKAFQSWLSNGLVGVTEAFPIARILGRVNRASGGGLQKILVDALWEGGTEAVQETIQQGAGNLIAQHLYDSERKLLDGLLDGGLGGFFSGVILSGLGSVAAQRRTDTDRAAELERPDLEASLARSQAIGQAGEEGGAPASVVEEGVEAEAPRGAEEAATAPQAEAGDTHEAAPAAEEATKSEDPDPGSKLEEIAGQMADLVGGEEAVRRAFLLRKQAEEAAAEGDTERARELVGEYVEAAGGPENVKRLRHLEEEAQPFLEEVVAAQQEAMEEQEGGAEAAPSEPEDVGQRLAKEIESFEADVFDATKDVEPLSAEEKAEPLISESELAEFDEEQDAKREIIKFEEQVKADLETRERELQDQGLSPEQAHRRALAEVGVDERRLAAQEAETEIELTEEEEQAAEEERERARPSKARLALEQKYSASARGWKRGTFQIEITGKDGADEKQDRTGEIHPSGLFAIWGEKGDYVLTHVGTGLRAGKGRKSDLKILAARLLDSGVPWAKVTKENAGKLIAPSAPIVAAFHASGPFAPTDAEIAAQAEAAPLPDVGEAGGAPIVVGDRVTYGDPNDVGTVARLYSNAGVPMAQVEYGKGRKPLNYPVSDFKKVVEARQPIPPAIEPTERERVEEMLAFPPPLFRRKQAGKPPTPAETAVADIPQGFDIPEESLLRRVQRKAQDYLNRVGLVQRSVAEQGGTVTEETDVYGKAQLFEGKIEEHQRRLDKEILRNLKATAGRGDITIEQIDEYLIARHAPDRNALVQRRRVREATKSEVEELEELSKALEKETKGLEKAKGMKGPQAATRLADAKRRIRDIEKQIEHKRSELVELATDVGEQWASGSGMTDEDAARIVAERESGKDGARYKRIGEIVDAMNRETRELLVQGGVISRETADAWERLFGDHYVPLRTDLEGGPVGAGGRGFSVKKGPVSKRAKGRESMADSPLSFSVLQYNQAAYMAEQNKVGLALKGLIEANPDENLWKVYPANEKPAGPYVVDPDRAMTVKVAGEPHIIELQDPLMARGMLKLGQVKGGSVVDGLAKLMRAYARMQTSWNPEFIVTNFARDMQTAGINLSTEKTGKLARAVVNPIHLAKAAKAALQVAKNPEAEGAYQDAFREMRRAGGKIGWYHYRDFRQTYEAIERDLQTLEDTGLIPRLWQATQRIGDVIDTMNSAVENAVRLSAYVELRKLGLSPQEAAKAVRSLTVDFNKKGEWGPALNAVYLFYNASTQGSARIAETLVRNPKKGMRLGASLVGFGFGLGVLGYLFGEDDEDGISEYDKIDEGTKARNIVIPIPGWHDEDGRQRHFKLPMPYGYSLFVNIGRQAAEVALGVKEKKKAAGQLALNVVDNFSPIGSESSVAQILSPTLADPFVQAWENKTFSGIPIMPERFGSDPTPASEMYFDSVSEPSKRIARAINKLTGGDEFEAGGLSISPEVFDHLFDFTIGGAGRFATRTGSLVMDLQRGERVRSHQVPFWRSVVGDAYDAWDRDRFFDHKEEMDILTNRISAANGGSLKNVDTRPTVEAERLIQENQEAWDMRNEYARKRGFDPSLEDVLRGLRDARTDEARKEERRIYLDFNSRWRKATGRKP